MKQFLVFLLVLFLVFAMSEGKRKHGRGKNEKKACRRSCAQSTPDCASRRECKRSELTRGCIADNCTEGK